MPEEEPEEVEPSLFLFKIRKVVPPITTTPTTTMPTCCHAGKPAYQFQEETTAEVVEFQTLQKNADVAFILN